MSAADGTATQAPAATSARPTYSRIAKPVRSSADLLFGFQLSVALIVVIFAGMYAYSWLANRRRKATIQLEVKEGADTWRPQGPSVPGTAPLHGFVGNTLPIHVISTGVEAGEMVRLVYLGPDVRSSRGLAGVEVGNPVSINTMGQRVRLGPLPSLGLYRVEYYAPLPSPTNPRIVYNSLYVVASPPVLIPPDGPHYWRDPLTLTVIACEGHPSRDSVALVRLPDAGTPGADADAGPPAVGSVWVQGPGAVATQWVASPPGPLDFAGANAPPSPGYAPCVVVLSLVFERDSVVPHAD